MECTSERVRTTSRMSPRAERTANNCCCRQQPLTNHLTSKRTLWHQSTNKTTPQMLAMKIGHTSGSSPSGIARDSNADSPIACAWPRFFPPSLPSTFLFLTFPPPPASRYTYSLLLSPRSERWRWMVRQRIGTARHDTANGMNPHEKKVRATLHVSSAIRFEYPHSLSYQA